MLPNLVRNHFVERAAEVGFRQSGCLSPLKRAKAHVFGEHSSASAASTPCAAAAVDVPDIAEAPPLTDENSSDHINRACALPATPTAKTPAAKTPAARTTRRPPQTPAITPDGHRKEEGGAPPLTVERLRRVGSGAICPQVEGRITRVGA